MSDHFASGSGWREDSGASGRRPKIVDGPRARHRRRQRGFDRDHPAPSFGSGACRPGKLTLAALEEATLAAYLSGRAWEHVPTLRFWRRTSTRSANALALWPMDFAGRNRRRTKAEYTPGMWRRGHAASVDLPTCAFRRRVDYAMRTWLIGDRQLIDVKLAAHRCRVHRRLLGGRGGVQPRRLAFARRGPHSGCSHAAGAHCRGGSGRRPPSLYWRGPPTLSGRWITLAPVMSPTGSPLARTRCGSCVTLLVRALEDLDMRVRRRWRRRVHVVSLLRRLRRADRRRTGRNRKPVRSSCLCSELRASWVRYRLPMACMLFVAEESGDMAVSVLGLVVIAIGQAVMGDDSVSDAQREQRSS